MAATVVLGAACLVLAAACLVASWANVAGFRRERRLPPLELDEILAVEAEPAVAGRWPVASSIAVPQEARAYRDLAYERRAIWLIGAEGLVLFASAALGATVGDVLAGGWRPLVPVGFVVLALAGLMGRMGVEEVFTRRIRRYERRRIELTKRPRRR